jgi:hypothetical protein
MKAILDFISNICPITGDGLVDTILFTIITAIAFFVAWNLTRAVADFSGSYDSGGMSALHWLVRALVFFLLLGIVIGIVNFIRWVGSWPLWGYLILGLGVTGAITGIVLIVVFRKKKNLKKPKIKR